mmetsp:Transcript_19816/g.51191  ORF Transcript_19816/g.51191 Transcript_19816/m.51191 type:complete len:513 (+) Transcript_19816:97-1635(+)
MVHTRVSERPPNEGGLVAAGGMSSGAIFTATPTALIIDDDPVARRRLESILTALGVAVTVCSSVAEGLKALQADIGENGCVTFTRIFCDIVMPEAPGDALLSLLTSSGWPCSIVMVTGCASEEQRIKCESMGATAVLSKPVRRTVLRPYFEADELRDGRRLPGRPQVTLSVASQASRVANALLSCPADINPSTRLHAPSWAGFDGVPAGRRRAASAPRQRIPGWRSIVPHASGGGGGAPGLGNAGARGGTGSPDVDSSHTSVAVHSLAMGAALALAVHVETTERDVVKETMTPELEAAAALFEEQVAAGEMAPRATPERIYRFLMVLIINNTLDMPVAIEAIIFLERATRRSGLRLSHTNWKSLLLTSIIVASKAHYDEQVWVEDFVSALKMYHLSAVELHRLEMALLQLTDYAMVVRQSTFTLYSMELFALHHSACPFCNARCRARRAEMLDSKLRTCSEPLPSAEMADTDDDEEEVTPTIPARSPRSHVRGRNGRQTVGTAAEMRKAMGC